MPCEGKITLGVCECVPECTCKASMIVVCSSSSYVTKKIELLGLKNHGLKLYNLHPSVFYSLDSGAKFVTGDEVFVELKANLNQHKNKSGNAKGSSLSNPISQPVVACLTLLPLWLLTWHLPFPFPTTCSSCVAKIWNHQGRSRANC